LMPNLSDADLMTCSTRGVIGAAPGIIGALQAMETIKLLTGIGSPLEGKLMVCDFSDMYITNIDISKSINCPVCHGEATTIAGRDRLVWLCGRDTANINPETPLKLTLEQIYPAISKQFNVRLRSRLALIFDYKGHEVSLFNGGRMLIKGVENENTAFAIYREILKKMSNS
jgi:hypothetical protein